MTVENHPLWQKILEFEIDDPTSDFKFTDRLVRENGWTVNYAIRAILEYKKFIFLICVSDQSMTPSDQVDQVWHLHLIYTRSYWEDLCRNTTQREIHHGPTKGGSSEKIKYADLYESTLQAYREWFETEPPSDIWPPREIRFGNLIFERVNRHRNWIIRKPTFWSKWKN